mgnify:CR=1 FL=1
MPLLDKRFFIRTGPADRAAIAGLAKAYGCTKAEVVRVIVRESWAIVQEEALKLASQDALAKATKKNRVKKNA